MLTQHDERSDGEELALPVLHGLEPEVRCGEELPRGDGLGAALQSLLLVVLGRAEKQVGQGRRRYGAMDRLCGTALERTAPP
jgi:hypothetical protein